MFVMGDKNPKNKMKLKKEAAAKKDAAKVKANSVAATPSNS